MFANLRALFVLRTFLSGQVVKHVEIIVFIGFFLHCNAGDYSSGTLWKVKTIKLFLLGEVKYFLGTWHLSSWRKNLLFLWVETSEVFNCWAVVIYSCLEVDVNFIWVWIGNVLVLIDPINFGSWRVCFILRVIESSYQ